MKKLIVLLILSVLIVLTGCQKKSIQTTPQVNINKIEKDALAGDATAQLKMGYTYYNGQNGVRKNYDKAEKWFLKAAEQGNSYAQTMLGIYHSALGNVHNSLSWFRKAIANGNPEAMWRLGSNYMTGHGVPKDPVMAFDLYEQAAKLGNPRAQEFLASCYLTGIGTKQNDKQAYRWFSISASKGFAIAEYKLGCCYHRGKGTDQNYKKAYHWFKKAAYRGHTDAQSALGYCFYHGLGTATNYREAAVWFRKAWNRSSEKQRKELRKTMIYRELIRNTSTFPQKYED